MGPLIKYKVPVRPRGGNFRGPKCRPFKGPFGVIPFLWKNWANQAQENKSEKQDKKEENKIEKKEEKKAQKKVEYKEEKKVENKEEKKVENKEEKQVLKYEAKDKDEEQKIEVLIKEMRDFWGLKRFDNERIANASKAANLDKMLAYEFLVC